MALTAKQIVKSIVPPLLWNIGRNLKRRFVHSVTHFQYAPRGWSTPLPGGSHSDDVWSAFNARDTEELIARIRAREPLLETVGYDHTNYILFGYALALAARHQTEVSVLDYGGRLGDYYWLGLALVPGVALEYHCKELPKVAEAGRRLTPEVTWHTDDGVFGRSYDLVMFSSWIQYLPNWQDILVRAGQSARTYLLLADVPTVRDVPAYVATQREGRRTNLQILMNRSEIVGTVEGAGLRLVREFAMGPHPPIAHAPEQPTCLGWLFQRNPAS
jgi:putative methyltransferase (TIGR04325 family)